MPTTYAHDLFGQKVYRQLPDQVKEIIRKNGELYRIGLHGPDIFFYYFIFKNHVSSVGYRMHKEKARAFFTQGMAQVRETGDEALLAYLLGFGCHYLLDSSCHPFVNEMNDKGRISHFVRKITENKGSLLYMYGSSQSLIMEENGKNPYAFYPSDCIKAKRKNAAEIHKAFPLVKTGDILLSLKLMKFMTNLLVCDDGGTRRARLSKLSSLGGRRAQSALIDHYMMAQPAGGSREPVEQLNTLFEKEVKEAPAELLELYQLSQEDMLLSERWNLTYNG